MIQSCDIHKTCTVYKRDSFVSFYPFSRNIEFFQIFTTAGTAGEQVRRRIFNIVNVTKNSILHRVWVLLFLKKGKIRGILLCNVLIP